MDDKVGHALYGVVIIEFSISMEWRNHDISSLLVVRMGIRKFRLVEESSHVVRRACGESSLGLGALFL